MQTCDRRCYIITEGTRGMYHTSSLDLAEMSWQFSRLLVNSITIGTLRKYFSIAFSTGLHPMLTWLLGRL